MNPKDNPFRYTPDEKMQLMTQQYTEAYHRAMERLVAQNRLDNIPVMIKLVPEEYRPWWEEKAKEYATDPDKLLVLWRALNDLLAEYFRDEMDGRSMFEDGTLKPTE